MKSKEKLWSGYLGRGGFMKSMELNIQERNALKLAGESR